MKTLSALFLLIFLSGCQQLRDERLDDEVAMKNFGHHIGQIYCSSAGIIVTLRNSQGYMYEDDLVREQALPNDTSPPLSQSQSLNLKDSDFENKQTFEGAIKCDPENK